MPLFSGASASFHRIGLMSKSTRWLRWSKLTGCCNPHWGEHHLSTRTWGYYLVQCTANIISWWQKVWLWAANNRVSLLGHDFDSWSAGFTSAFGVNTRKMEAWYSSKVKECEPEPFHFLLRLKFGLPTLSPDCLIWLVNAVQGFLALVSEVFS